MVSSKRLDVAHFVNVLADDKALSTSLVLRIDFGCTFVLGSALHFLLMCEGSRQARLW